MKKLFTPILLPHWSADLMLLLPRIICGFLLSTDFGAAKFGLPWSPAENNLRLFDVAFWFPSDVAAFGGIFKTFPAFFAWMGAFSEAVGGIFLMLGFHTRFFSFLNLCTMLVAAFLQQADGGIWNMLPALGFAWVMLYLVVLGAGRFSVDALLVTKVPAKAIPWAYALLLLFPVGAGVQPAFDQQVTYLLDVSALPDVQKVAIRGGDKPLSWQDDLELKPMVKDSLYGATVTYRTGYLFTEVKFVVNNEFELTGKANRRIHFARAGRTEYRTRFDETALVKQ